MSFDPLIAHTGRIHLCGHRGHSVGAPENTLPALTRAAELGAGVAEIDVVLTRDDALVLMHDEFLDRTTGGTGPIDEVDLVDVRKLDAGIWFGRAFAATPVPTLAEAIAHARMLGIGLLVEIKERRRQDLAVQRIALELKRLDATADVLVISFDHPSLVALRQTLPAARTELITHARHLDPASLVQAAGAVSISIEWDMFDSEDTKSLHAAGIAIRLSLPRPDELRWRKEHGRDAEPAIRAVVRAGQVDMLSGDDVAYLRDLAGPAA